MEALPDSSVVWSVSVLSLILQLVQRWEIVELQRLIALLPGHPRTTATLACELVTYIVHRASHITTTLCASKQVFLMQAKCPIMALVAAERGDSRLTNALSSLSVTSSHAPQRAWDVAVAGLTA